MKKQALKGRLNVIGLGLILFSVIRYFLPRLGALAGVDSYPLAWILLYAVTLVVSCIVPIAVIENMCSFHPDIGYSQPDLRDLVIGIAGLLVIEATVFLNQLLLFLLAEVGIAFPRQTMMKTDGFVRLLAYFLYMTVLPAVFEELLLRGITFNLLGEHGTRFGILASAGLFMLMHSSVQTFIPVFVSGVLLACAYRYTGKIVTPMIMHFLNNAFSFLIMHMDNATGDISAAGFAAFMYILLLVLGGTSVWLLYKSDNNFLKPLAEKDREERSSMWSAPVFVMGLACLALTVFSQMYRDLVLR